MVNHTLAGLQGRQDLQDLAQRAGGDLRQIVHDEVGRLFGEYLFEAQKALKAKDLRKGAELERSLKQRAEDWKARFLQQLESRLFLEDEGADDSESEERASAGLIAMAKALLLAETQYFKIIAEINARLNRIALLVELPFNTKALSPTGLHQALLRTLDELRWPSVAREPMLLAFEQHFVSKLEPLYRRVMEALKDIGSEAAHCVVDEPLSQPKASAQEAKPRDKDQWMRPPDDKLKVDDTTAGMLTRLALQHDGEGYTDGLLAADLLALMDKKPLPGIAKEQGWVPVQRTSLAGHFLNEVKADPMVPKEEDEKHETLRMPLVKSAIADSSVFTDASHPLASLIDEHMTKAAKHRLHNVEESEQMMDSLQEILSLFDLAPDFVRESMGSAKPLEDSQIERFYDLQRKQAAQRREFVISEAKRTVAEEIERSSFARDIPPPAQRFFSKVWAALLTQRLLKFGASDTRWTQAIDKMDQLIDLLEARNPREAPPADWVALIKSICTDLTAGGLPDAQKAAVLKMLEAARKSP